MFILFFLAVYHLKLKFGPTPRDNARLVRGQVGGPVTAILDVLRITSPVGY